MTGPGAAPMLRIREDPARGMPTTMPDARKIPEKDRIQIIRNNPLFVKRNGRERFRHEPYQQEPTADARMFAVLIPPAMQQGIKRPMPNVEYLTMIKILYGTIIALFIASVVLVGAVTAEQDTPGTVLTDDIRPYDGPIGPDSPLYGLKLALEDMDESFTANETERVDKQMNHARLRLSEVRRSLDLNQSDSVRQALDNYWLKMNLTNMTIAMWKSNATGLLHAEEMIVKHQYVLENLLARHPNNTGLQRAYNNSLRLEERFTEKTAIRFNRTMEKNNQTIIRAIRLEQKEHDRKGWADTTTSETTVQTDDKQRGWEKDKGKNSGNSNMVTTVTTLAPATYQLQNQGKDRGQGNQQDDTGKGNTGDKGNGNSKNK